MPLLNTLRIPLLSAAMVLAGLTNARAAPQALMGKTVTMTWTEVRQEKFDSLDGAMTTVTVNFALKTYVSEKGRAFTSMTRNGGPSGGGGGGVAKRSDQGPTDQNSLGSAGAVSFSGQRMTVTRTFASGARQVSATFDTSFATCETRISVGKQGGSGYLAATAMNGRKEYIFSSVVSGERCAVAAGNGIGQ